MHREITITIFVSTEVLVCFQLKGSISFSPEASLTNPPDSLSELEDGLFIASPTYPPLALSFNLRMISL